MTNDDIRGRKMDEEKGRREECGGGGDKCEQINKMEKGMEIK